METVVTEAALRMIRKANKRPMITTSAQPLLFNMYLKHMEREINEKLDRLEVSLGLR